MATKAKTPAKPRKDYPLFFHKGTGQWCKKVAQKFYYFGTDPEEAERRWDREKDGIRNGRPVERESADGESLGEMVNAFLSFKRTLVDRGKITAYTFADCYRVCETLINYFGRESRPANYRADDFGRFCAKLAETMKSPVTMANTIIRVRSFFNWALTNDHMVKPIKYGDQFEIPDSKEKRKAKNRAKREGQGRTFTAEECRKIIDSARQPLKAMILLGLNCGFGQNDVGNLPIGAIDLDAGWINFPRVKTETDRRCPLWPKTVEALREWLVNRPSPVCSDDEHLAFLTVKGNRWIQKGTFTPENGKPGEMYYFNDNVAKEFVKLLGKLELKRRGSFYNLRHTFRTEAANAKDREAIDAIMGHVDPSMGGNYIDHIEDDRLKAITDHVCAWLWPKAQTKAKGKATSKPAQRSRRLILPLTAAAG